MEHVGDPKEEEFCDTLCDEQLPAGKVWIIGYVHAQAKLDKEHQLKQGHIPGLRCRCYNKGWGGHFERHNPRILDELGGHFTVDLLLIAVPHTVKKKAAND